MKKKIIVLAGDGIGPEIMESGLRVLSAVEPQCTHEFEIQKYPFGGAGIDAAGSPLPIETLAACQQADAILLGAIGGPKWDKEIDTPEKGLLALRKTLKLFANIRPVAVSATLAPRSPLKPEIIAGTDLVIVRELSSGIYFGEPRELTATMAYDTARYQKNEIEQILHTAFKIAQGRRKQVTSVDKANVLASSKLWRATAEEVSKAYPDCQLNHQYVDSAAMKLIQRPTDFDVIVTDNLFGDILSDEASVLPGTLGVLPSASHSSDGPSLYEPIHGSAPDIAGQGLANPMSMILSIAMMLRQSFAEEHAAQLIEKACDQVLAQGIATSDLGGTASTTEFTAAVIQMCQMISATTTII
ncbi:3-isopropylmalate dehydrogenase [Enterococcus hermanniensis]|uniref:3-isopropylmalate dehydrogenase n=1 Tax=Enterococcus hermanniensis TaxID=249189 RepID=A0A1L8TRG4_9ENTE|nr:3-isopropylmalate dehydrogenase [Enterococcus hermanniensis]OJG46911.1 3-isopropylmalate dehydrogenase [Enterococcus hermanniensis]